MRADAATSSDDEAEEEEGSSGSTRGGGQSRTDFLRGVGLEPALDDSPAPVSGVGVRPFSHSHGFMS